MRVPSVASFSPLAAMQRAPAPARAALTWKDIAAQKADYLCSGKGWTGLFADTDAFRQVLMLPPSCGLPDITVEKEDDTHVFVRLNLAGWALLRKDGPRLHEVHGAARIT